MLKKLSKYILCIITVMSLLSSVLYISAEETPDGQFKIDTVSAINGDTVLVPVYIENNPGIMAMTISITYDSSALEYVGKYPGFLSDYTFAAHPDKNIIRFVNCEKEDIHRNGRIFSIKFKIKEDADYGFYPISIDYKKGDFCNWKLEKLMPSIVAGGIDIAYNGKNCKHKKYGDWEVVAEPTCTENGAKQRTCLKCPHVELGEVPPAGHDYAREWTVDKPATEKESGIMSRHCKNCDSTTDLLTIPLKITEKGEIENVVGSIVKPSETTDELVKDQLPDIYKENGGSSLPPEKKPTENSGSATIVPLTEIFEQIENSSSGKLQKILDAIPNIDIVKTFLTVALIILLRFILI